jgi:hypothetical protein
MRKLKSLFVKISALKSIQRFELHVTQKSGVQIFLNLNFLDILKHFIMDNLIFWIIYLHIKHI